MALSGVSAIVTLIVILCSARFVGGSGDSTVVVGLYESTLSGYYFVPIVLFGIAGAVCLMWRSKMPPKIDR